MREIAWVKAALKDFNAFPEQVRERATDALAIAGFGQKADIAKPMLGLGAGVFEIVLPHKGNAFRVIYALQIADVIWVVHAFQKKSTKGIATPQREVDLIRNRIKRIREL